MGNAGAVVPAESSAIVSAIPPSTVMLVIVRGRPRSLRIIVLSVYAVVNGKLKTSAVLVIPPVVRFAVIVEGILARPLPPKFETSTLIVWLVAEVEL